MSSKKGGSTAVVVGLLIAAAAIGGSGGSSSPKHTSVWGDSLTVDAQKALSARGAAVHAKGGTAPCDWLPGFEQRLESDGTSRVLLAFVGNTSTPCMVGIHTAAELAARYRRDLSRLIAIAVRHRATVTLVVPPYMDPNRPFYMGFFGAPELTSMECDLAGTLPDWVNCDTHARDALAVNNRYSLKKAGVTVRRSDGVHLTPAGGRLYANGMLASGRPSGGGGGFPDARKK